MAIDYKTFVLDTERLRLAEDRIDNYQRQIHQLQQFQNALYKEISKLKSNYPLPTISISEVHPRDENVKGITFPHLRGTCYYDYLGKKERFSVYIGPVSDFEHSTNDPKAFQIAIDKSFMYLKKKFPNDFIVTDMS